MDNEKIKVLTNENQIIRSEIVMLVKTFHNLIFAFFTSIGIFIALLVQLDLQVAGKNIQEAAVYNSLIGLLTFLITQIEFIVIVYSILLNSDIHTQAAYIEYVETKINSLLKEDLIFFETKIKAFDSRTYGTLLITTGVLNFCYLTFFSALAVFCYTKAGLILYLLIQIVEFLIVCFLLFKLSKERSKVREYISQIVLKKKLKRNEISN